MDTQAKDIYTVSKLNQNVRRLLESKFAHIWIEGELSNFVAPHSGHWYFSLKDDAAQIRCACFRQNNRRCSFDPKDGMQVLLKAQVSLYPARGDYQLIVESIEEAGVGALQRAFEALKKKLSAEGLFEKKYKKSIPEQPERIGVITSATGAAVRDILHVLKRRAPHIPVIIYPTLVQGDLASDGIVKAIKKANKRVECDVILLSRGGGSAEDLWPFNGENVARAIFDSDIPILSGVGHEIDFTIADFVADLRAPTPSAAAELVSPDGEALLEQIQGHAESLEQLMQGPQHEREQEFNWLKKYLKQLHPINRIQEQYQSLDQLIHRLHQHQQTQLHNTHRALNRLLPRLSASSPLPVLSDTRHALAQAYSILSNRMQHAVTAKQHAFKTLAAQLDAVSPLATLARGYAVATLSDGSVLKDAKQAKSGDTVALQLAKGELSCSVD
jgi:exodeoxyribonuclease VII large subunit